MLRRVLPVFAVLLANSARAEEPALEVAPVKVLAKRRAVGVERELPNARGAEIYAGKKTTVTELKTLPTVTNNNYRQIFALTPGLLIGEVGNNSWTSLTYRGLGDPHESWNLLILKDGIPIGADMYSYPAAYYQPATEQLSRVEFIRGGASLLHGPLPGGTLNSVSREPAKDKPITAFTKNLYGSHALFNTYSRVEGTQGKWGYLVDFSRFQSDGLRRQNSDFWAMNATANVFYQASSRTKLTLRTDFYSGSFGEPGGLTRTLYNQDRTQTTTPFDRFRPLRGMASARVDHRVDDQTSLEATVWASGLNRTSRRQGGTSFGVLSSPNNVAIVQSQRFYTLGALARGRHDYDAFGKNQTLTGGFLFYGNLAPVHVDKGISATDDDGRGGALSRVDRATFSNAFFAENVVNFGRLKIIPGARVEFIRQRVHERLDLAQGSPTDPTPGAPNGPLSTRDSYAPVVLPGVGASYTLTDGAEAYANATRGYKPKIFNDGVTFQSGVNVIGNFDPSYTYSGEVGVRGRPLPWLHYDASAFYIMFTNQVGALGTDVGGATRTNIGRMENKGIEGAVEAEVVTGLTLYGNASLLDAELTTGPAKGQRPQYAPPYLVRAGAIYRGDNRYKVALLGTLLGKHSAVDNNHPLFAIPAYSVWDLTAEIAVWKENLSLIGGINNLLDAHYFARVRPGGGGGIDPALGRNVYVGFTGRL